MAQQPMRGRRFMRYLAAGAANTVFGFAVYSGLIIAGAPVWLALLCATVLGIAFNFFSTGGFVFDDLGLARLPRFVVCYAVVYVINLGLIEAVMACCTRGKIAAQAVITLPMALCGYYLLKTFVYSNAESRRGDPD